MKHFILAFTSVFLALSLSGCFEVEEEITLNRDGSGSYSMLVDMTDLMEMINSFAGDEMSSDSMEESLDSTMTENLANVQSVEGISNVSKIKEGYRFGMSYDFASIEALNDALRVSNDDDSPVPSYSLSKKVFQRDNLPPEIFNSISDDMDEESASMVRSFFADSKYTLTYHLPGKVKKMENESAVIQSDNRTVVLEMTFLELLDGDVEVGNQIKFK